MNWKDVNKELPKVKARSRGGYVIIETMLECIVTDGEDVWVDSYCPDEGFHESVTNYCLVKDIKPPVDGRVIGGCDHDYHIRGHQLNGCRECIKCGKIIDL
jgi:hypothetical protein